MDVAREDHADAGGGPATSRMNQSRCRTMDPYSASTPNGASFGRIAVIVCRSTCVTLPSGRRMRESWPGL